MLTETRVAPPARALFKRPKEIVYPESDGKPLAETDIHFTAIAALIALLRRHYATRNDVYVAGCNFVYYKEGDNKARFSPDAYVVFGVDSAKRRSYFLWKEQHPPAVVFEFTSRKTKKVDATTKKELCASLGVKEYFLCDPETAYLKPPLQGYRLKGGMYQPIKSTSDGRVHCQELGVMMRLENRYLALYDAVTGERILSAEESERAEASRARSEAERAHRAEAEIVLLRAELDRLKNPTT
ncbi:MAG: Uma2 family endonuclease [Planctomycetota bacterium]